jgi:hypothetical protein
MREDGSYDQNTFRDRLGTVDKEMASVAPPDASAAEAFRGVDAQAVADAARWFVANVRTIWHHIPPPSRLRFERLAFPKGIVYVRPEGCRTDNPGLIFGLIRAAATAKSPKVMLKGFSSNQLAEYFEELLAFYHEMKDGYSEEADMDMAA